MCGFMDEGAPKDDCALEGISAPDCAKFESVSAAASFEFPCC